MFDTSRQLILLAFVAWVGSTLLLSELRPFRAVSLTQRLMPFSGLAKTTSKRSALSFRELINPIAAGIGQRIATSLGVREDLSTRLSKAKLEQSTSDFRFRQLAFALTAVVITALTAVTFGIPTLPSLILTTSSPVLAYLIPEQQLSTRIKSRQQKIFQELPVITEQVATLLGAGYSLGSALNRISTRSVSATSEDIAVVCDRIRQGLTASQALKEWAVQIDIPELDRLVSVLDFSSETSDLARLVSDEAKSMRLESHRRLLADIDKKSQQVWIPVTVAALIPGVIFITIPFMHALQQFSTSQ